MSNSEFEVSINQESISRKLYELKIKTGDLSQPLHEIGQYLLASTDKGFEKEQNPYSVPWKQNTPYTLRLKKARGQILKVLQATGRLRASISYQVNSNTLILGTNVGYAYKHQLGVEVTQREFLGVSDENLVDINSILDDYFLG
jgi:phage virion morphogenesis protein